MSYVHHSKRPSADPAVDLAAAVKRVEADPRAAAEQLLRGAREIKKLAAQLPALREDLAAAQQRTEQAEVRAKKLQGQLDDAHARNHALRAANEQGSASLVTAREELEDARGAVDALARDLAFANEATRVLGARVTEFQEAPAGGGGGLEAIITLRGTDLSAEGIDTEQVQRTLVAASEAIQIHLTGPKRRAPRAARPVLGVAS